MNMKKRVVYRVRCYPRIQVSTEGLGTLIPVDTGGYFTVNFQLLEYIWSQLEMNTFTSRNRHIAADSGILIIDIAAVLSNSELPVSVTKSSCTVRSQG
jgi:hypothetical protein